MSRGAAAPRRAIVLIGFMGAGKTSVARMLAADLGSRATDADALLEERLGPIEEIFARYGERRFREEEERTVLELLEDPPTPVVSLGGGAVLSERVQQALARHVTVLLDVDADTAWRRVAHTSRPLARDEDRFTRLLAERRPLYEHLADAVLPATARDVARRALPALVALRDEAPAGTRLAWATTAAGDAYPCWVGEHLLGAFDGRLDADPTGRAFVVTDDVVGPLYADRLAAEATLTMPAGEEAKHLGTVSTLLSELATRGARHGDHVVALGGGVVGDTAGFCAAVYQRGIGVVQVPTTVVAQVDSAYGGKTGVDLPEGKNYAGAYHQPSAVLADVATLATLPAEELAAGFAEVVKTALIAGGPLWERVRRWPPGVPPDRDLVLACARLKLGVVAADERDGGVRQVLNLGHTVGHAIETVTGYARYRHGEAVALGLLAALQLSGAPRLREEVRVLLEAHGLPTSLDPSIDRTAVAAATAKDKKARGGKVGYVLLSAPGTYAIGAPVTDAELDAALVELA